MGREVVKLQEQLERLRSSQRYKVLSVLLHLHLVLRKCHSGLFLFFGHFISYADAEELRSGIVSFKSTEAV
jgi:hypothetical protein